jgi:hypothetical protein
MDDARKNSLLISRRVRGTTAELHSWWLQLGSEGSMAQLNAQDGNKLADKADHVLKDN